VLVLGGLGAAAPPAAAEVVPTNEWGCPADFDSTLSMPCVLFSVECSKDGVLLRLANAEPAAQDAVFDVRSGAGGEAVVTVRPNDTVFAEIPLDEDESTDLWISERWTGQAFAEGVVLTLDCEPPVPPAGVTVDWGTMTCSTPATITVSNSGAPADLQLVLGVYGHPPIVRFLDAFTGTATFTYAPETNGTQSGALQTRGGGQLVSSHLYVVDDCATPTAEATWSCRDGQVVVGYTTPPGQTRLFLLRWSVDGGPENGGAPVIVPSPGETSFTFPLTEDGTYHVVLAWDGTVASDLTFVADCAHEQHAPPDAQAARGHKPLRPLVRRPGTEPGLLARLAAAATSGPAGKPM
jgi:hypothetical protein